MAKAKIVPVSMGGVGGPRIGLGQLSEDGKTIDIRLYPGVVIPGLTDGTVTSVSIVNPLALEVLDA